MTSSHAIAAAMLVAGCGRGAPRAPAPHAMTAPDIVKAMAATYAKLATYTDHGTVTSGYGEPERKVTATKSFDTAFVRSTRFRFDLRDENAPTRGLVIWADGSHTYSRWYGPPRTTDDGTALGVAIAVAAKPSLDVAPTIAHLLRPDAVSLAELTELRLDGVEAIDDHPCWIVRGRRADLAITLWIDRASFALRRAEERDGDTVDIASFTPVFAPPLQVAQVTPPDFSDDYATDSPIVLHARALVNTPAPAFEALVVSGAGQAKLAALAGHVVVVDFWATWCGPCQQTLPRLNALHHRLADRGVQIIGLSSEDVDDIRALATKDALDYTIAQDTDAKAARAYQVTAIPMLVVVDRAGVIRYVTLGAGDLDAVEAVIENLLQKAVP